MLKLNNTLINSKHKCTNFIKLNEISNIEDNENKIENYYKVTYSIKNKIFFVETLKQYFNKKDTFILYVNSNNINISFDLDRLNKFIEYVTLNNKDRVSDEYLLLRYGFINKKDREKRSISKDNYIEKFGIEIGTQKYNKNTNTQKQASKRSIDYWLNIYKDQNIALEKLNEYQSSHIKKHLTNKDQNYINNYNKTNSPWNIEFYIKKGFSIDESKKIISNIKKDSSLFCEEHYLNRGYNIDEAKELKQKYWIKHCYNNGTNVSKKSLLQFNEIINILNKIPNICVYYGDKETNKKEYFLYDKVNKRYFFYDLTILYGDIKLIIEYHGHKFHPDLNKLSFDDWKKWKCLFNEKIDANTKYEYDEYKQQLALDNGFQYLVIWDNDDFEENNNKIKKYIQHFIKNK